uniref:Cell migration inducing hyaluronidase 2 n=1 Tax=Neogobius melanostomus TaxID=47308 RepID=A0A8C6UUF0_9GOBI
MPTSDGQGRYPVFVAPSPGTHPRSPGYVPGRVAPVRSPPLAKAPPPPPIKPHGPPPQRQVPRSQSEERHQRERAQSLQRRKNTLICFGASMCTFLLSLILIFSLSTHDVLDANCPDQNPSLSSWNPGHQPDKSIIVRKGHLFRLESSATFLSLTIQSGGRVVFADSPDGSRNITLRTGYILIEDGGALHIGASKCRYRSRAAIALTGRSDSQALSDVAVFGRKFIGVMSGATLELHGTERISWSLLTRTIPASGLATGGYSFQRNFSRGINLRVVDQDTSAVLFLERYDTHDSRNDSRRLTQLLRALPEGRIVALAVGDSAVKSLLEETKKAIEERLGSSYVYDLKYRQAWALVSVVGGGNTSCSEDVKEHENHDTGGKAWARRNFTTVNGVGFSVSAYSEWKNGKPQYSHVGEIFDGIDMRAEVALLSRNVIIYGEMENVCYGDNQCQFFNHDTFGGHIKILGNFSSVHLSHVELKNMGQQREIGRYPLHFHLCGDVDRRGGYWEPTYVDGLSIHHSFSRCLAVHATNGLLVKNTVGYDTLGHCFFLEDGIEQRNTFYHNLGMLTRPGTLLPTDRNETLCTSIRDRVYKGYTPSPSTECKAVSTFWIANPNNNLISNAAAGSQDAGIWFVFHSTSTGDSHGRVPETKAELTPLGIFYNNRVHSNFKAGLFIDKGVKTTNASAADPREYLCLDNNARFRPHKDADPSRPRVSAVIDTLISFKNNDLGAWVRGGDIVIQNSGFADNGVGLSFASDGSYPKDEGSSQEVTQSLFVGESRNRGTNGGQNKYWGQGGVDGKMRTLPRNRTFPIRGFQIYDGPVRLTQSTFRGFVPTTERYTSAVGFNLKNTWQLTPRNNLSQLAFHSTVSLRAFFGRPGQWFEENDLDGDKNSIFHDVDGSVTGYRDTYMGRADNYIIQHPACINKPQWNGVICSGRYSQVYIQTRGAPSLTLSISRDEYPHFPLILRGINSHGALSQQYQPILMMSKSYTLHWSGPAPREVALSLINFDKDDWVLMGLCYQPETAFQIMADINDRQSNTFDELTDYGTVSSLEELQKRPTERKYFFDQSVGLLWLYLRARHSRDGHSYCSVKGCERVKVLATATSKQTCNCTAKAYPKYAKPPSATVPMPAPNTQPCQNCGAKQVAVFSSEPWAAYLQTQIKSLSSREQQMGDNSSFITVNGTVSKNGNTKEVKRIFSPVFFIVVFIRVNRAIMCCCPFRVIVLLATRGQLDDMASLAQHLVSFGLAKAADLHNKGVGSFLLLLSLFYTHTSQGDEFLGVQERYLPLALESYGCPQPGAPARKDLKLLKIATGIK